MVAPHNVGGVISTLAALHLCFTLRNVKILEHFNDFADPFVKKVANFYPEVKDGFFNLPEGPGWGVEIDEDFILAHPPDKSNQGLVLDPGLNMFEKTDWAKRGQSE
jgi:galactonate dehydratase